MSILYISYDGAQDPLGESQILPYLMKLSFRGAQISLLTFEKLDTNAGGGRLKQIKEELKGYRISWKRLRYHKYPRSLATLYDISVGLFYSCIIAVRQKAYIIHGRSFIGAVIGMIAAVILRKKFLLDYRGFWPDERVDDGTVRKGSVLYNFLKIIERWLLISADEIVVLTHKAKEALLALDWYIKIKAEITVIPTCVDLDRFRPPETNFVTGLKDGITLSYLGSLGTWYMLNEMADYFSELLCKSPASRLIFISPASSEIINKVMFDREIPPSAYSINHLSYRQVPEVLQKSDITIYFIKPVFSKISSCPTKLAESLACGIPVITNSGIGDCDQILGDNGVGIILRDFSLEAYRKSFDTLERVLRDRNEMKIKCRQTAERCFSLDKASDAYYRLYNQLYIRSKT